MENSIFIEQLVKRHRTKAETKTGVIIFIITAAFIFLWFNLNFLPAIILLVAVTLAIAFFFFNFFMNKEYEYCFVDGELDIDVIYNKTRRRRVFAGETMEFEVMAHYNDSEHLDFYNNFGFKDFSGGIVGPNTYVFVTSHKGKKFRYVIEPNDELLEAIRRRMQPQNFYRKVKAEDKLNEA